MAMSNQILQLSSTKPIKPTLQRLSFLFFLLFLYTDVQYTLTNHTDMIVYPRQDWKTWIWSKEMRGAAAEM